MKKTLSFILCAVMILSMFAVFSVSAAPAGDAINSAADFMAMLPDGKYYLNADIVLTGTYDKEFVGVLDGNGKKVTISAPMFQTFSGTISNLNIAGEVTGNTDLGAIAVNSNGMIANGVTNNANIKVTGTDAENKTGFNAGGFIADADAEGKTLIVLRNCVNNGIISVETAVVKDESSGAQYETHAGGFVGRCSGIDARFCTNNGNITAASNRGQAAGIVARACWKNSALRDFNYLEIQDCDNKGDITSAYDAGGFVAYVGCADNDIGRAYKIDYCCNTGDITGGYRVGGFVGYSYSSGKNLTYWLEVTNSISIADVSGGQPQTNLAGDTQYAFVSLFVGYSNSVHNKILNCIASGELKANAPADPNVPNCEPFFVIWGCSSAITPNCKLENNFMYDNNTTVYYSYATAEKNSAQIIPVETAITDGKVSRVTLDEIKNGTAMTNVNTAVNADIFSQEAGSAHPVINAALRNERKAADAVNKGENIEVSKVDATTADPFDTTAEITNPPKPTEATTTENEPTTDAATTAAPTTEPEEKSCGGVAGIAAVIAVVISTVGCAIVIKKH